MNPAPLPTDATVRAMFRDTYDIDLRDRFAGQAMAASIADADTVVEWRNGPDENSFPDYVAELAYEYADAMLRARATLSDAFDAAVAK